MKHLLALLLLALGCQSDPAPSTPPAPAPAAPITQPARSGPRVIFPTAGGPTEVRVVLARTPEEIRRGLMFVEKLEAGRGMLFLMPERRIQRFWMQNTYIPLDMIFIDEDFKVVGIVENAEPLTETSRFVDHPSRYVLEVRGGYTRAKGIAPGQVVTFADIPR